MTDTTITGNDPARDSDKPDHYFQLDAAETLAWDLLEHGAKSAKTTFHTPVLATVGGDGAPYARTVVLREASRESRLLRANTDARSPKAEQLHHDSRVQLVFYDAAAKLQLRVTARAALLAGGKIRDAAWQASDPGSRVCYLVEAAPGTARPAPTSGLPDFADGGKRVALDLLETGSDNFAIMQFHVEALDWLYLDSSGHRRAQFDYVAGTSGWVVP